MSTEVMMTKDESKEETLALGIGPAIKALRLRLGLTLEQMQERCELSKPLLSQLENCLVMPTLPSLLRVSKALGVDVGYWFMRDDLPKGEVDPAVEDGEEKGAGPKSVLEALEKTLLGVRESVARAEVLVGLQNDRREREKTKKNSGKSETVKKSKR